MTAHDDWHEAVVIGAGWAGLGVSSALRDRGIPHRVFERGRIGETWRTQRWDSFHLNTANLHTVMPGDIYTGDDPDGAMACGDFVAMLADYAARRGLPVETGTPVTGLRQEGDGFRVTLPGGVLRARSVVLANGTQNLPQRPPVTNALPPEIRQIDASGYRNAASLPHGAILVVGSGQSGGQIAEDLVRSGRQVFLATCKVGRQPRNYRGRHIMHWLVAAGLFSRTRAEMLAEGPIPTRPITGARATISLQSLSAEGVVLLGRLTGCEGWVLSFSDDVAAHIRHADAYAAELRSKVDAYIAASGIDAPEAVPDPAETVPPRLPDPPILSLDARASKIGTVIWCTGFRGDFGWCDVPGLLDDRGQPLQENNFAAVPGLYVPGMPFAVTRLSGTIHTIGDEAARIAADIAQRAAAAAPAGRLRSGLPPRGAAPR